MKRSKSLLSLVPLSFYLDEHWFFHGHLCVVWKVLLCGVTRAIPSTTDPWVQLLQLLPLAVCPTDPTSSGSLSPWVAFLGRSHHGALNMHPCVHGKHLHSWHPKDCFGCCSPLAFNDSWLYLASCFLLSLAGKWIRISVFTPHPINPQVILILPPKYFSNRFFPLPLLPFF